MRSHCLFKEGFGNGISIASIMRRLNVLLSVARTFVLLESTECLVSWQCSLTSGTEFLERCYFTLVSDKIKGEKMVIRLLLHI